MGAKNKHTWYKTKGTKETNEKKINYVDIYKAPW